CELSAEPAWEWRETITNIVPNLSFSTLPSTQAQPFFLFSCPARIHNSSHSPHLASPHLISSHLTSPTPPHFALPLPLPLTPLFTSILILTLGTFFQPGPFSPRFVREATGGGMFGSRWTFEL